MNTINAKKISIGILTLLVLIFIQISVNAQNPPISGDWAGYFPNGTKSAFVWRLSFPNDSLIRFEDVGAGTKRSSPDGSPAAKSPTAMEKPASFQPTIKQSPGATA